MVQPGKCLRVASAVLSLFAIGHTFGHFTRKNIPDESVQQLIKAMEHTAITLPGGIIKTYDQLFDGQSLL
eukprot:CAMPEP_0202913518 /NCGR_PEP_ID=MMETSP1392-20130828/60692_1 /ASSEMBLY_ACC=CAM_ASM_000868 /TAXON_ID=225041 /ORGANISM="Chlamydomonas chlamydogama, Strain SAG 11-48b" /LENGTH=69 /DNA_ID=CAMNT_0049604805 /DNA_START=142 /DNA_END=351 /DNA_ORIENTATION=+